MPIYEYRCEDCGHDFETLVRSAHDVPHCPSCGEVEHLTKQFSVPAAAQVGGPRGSSLPVCEAPSGGGCGMGGCGPGMCGMG